MTVHSLLYTVHNTALSRISHFYSASAFLAMQLAMQTAVIARPFLSVCPSRSGVLSRRRNTIMRFSMSVEQSF